MIIPHLLFFLIPSIETSFFPDNLDRRVRSNSEDQNFCTSYKCSQADSIQTMYIGYSLDGGVSSSYEDNSECQSYECDKTGATTFTNLDETVDPCEDFYEFACGGWKKLHTIPEDEDYVSVVSEMQDEVNLRFRRLLEKKLDGSELPFVKMVKEFYDSCMDLATIEDEGEEPLLRMLKSLGGWPVVEGSDWDGSNFDWIQFLASFRESGFHHDIMLYLLVRIDYRNDTLHILELEETPLSVHRTHLLRGLNDSATAAYFLMMLKAAKILGAIDDEIAENELLEVLNFEIALANCTRSYKKRSQKKFCRYTIQDLQESLPQIPWLKFFNALIIDEIQHENGAWIETLPEFLQNFYDLISQTDKRVVANYMLWKLMYQYFFVLSKDWNNILHEYLIALHGVSSLPPRKELCFSNVTSNFGIALSSYYVRNYFGERIKNAASRIVEYIHEEFLYILEESDWMDENTKKQAMAKARNIKAYIGYPSELLDDTAVMEVYQNLKISNESYFENVRRLQKWKYEFDISQLRKANTWKKNESATTVNAFHNDRDVSIEFPAGILQSAFFKIGRPNYLNFAAIGSFIGHEITHGFDNAGRLLDKDGRRVNWWDKTTIEHYKKRTQCLIDQYNNYGIENGTKVDGLKTINENIADNAGLKTAYRAYQTWVSYYGAEQLLPQLKYSQNQAFWISAASPLCENIRPRALGDQISSSFMLHSPNKFRINGAMSNLAEFAKDFNCPPDSPMNKQPKCEVW